MSSVPELGVLCVECGNIFLAHRDPLTRQWILQGETECSHTLEILEELGGNFADELDYPDTEPDATETLH